MNKHGWKFICLIVITSILFLWLIKPSVLSSYLSYKMGIPITMRTIKVRPSETLIRNFRIENPREYRKRTAFEADRARIAYRFGAVTSDPRKIDLITMDDVYLYVYIPSPTGAGNNWSAIAASIPKGKRGREFIIDRLVVRNLTVKIQGAGAKVLRVYGERHFDQIELNNIDSKNGFPTRALIEQIFKRANLFELVNPVKQIQNTINPFNIFGQKKAPEKTPEAFLSQEQEMVD